MKEGRDRGRKRWGVGIEKDGRLGDAEKDGRRRRQAET